MFRGVGNCFLEAIYDSFLFLRVGNKRGDLEIDELIKLLFFVIVAIVVIGGVIFLFWGKGGRLLSSVRDLFRFGG